VSWDVVVAVDMRFMCGRWIIKAMQMRDFCERQSPTTGTLTTPRLRGTPIRLEAHPRIAIASTNHRRDEQSNADGNLTGHSYAGGAVVLHTGRPITAV